MVDRTIRKGDSKIYYLTVKQNGVAFPLTGYTIKFVVRVCPDDVTPLIEKTATITDESGGLATVSLSPTDTDIPFGYYMYDFDLIQGSTFKRTLDTGTLQITLNAN